MATRKYFTKEQDPAAFLDMVQQMAVHLSCIEVAFQTDLVDTKFKAAEVNNAVRTMRNSIKVINAYINRVTSIKENKDVFAYDYIPELFEVCRNLMFCKPETLAQMAKEMSRLREVGGGEFALQEIGKQKQGTEEEITIPRHELENIVKALRLTIDHQKCDVNRCCYDRLVIQAYRNAKDAMNGVENNEIRYLKPLQEEE